MSFTSSTRLWEENALRDGLHERPRLGFTVAFQFYLLQNGQIGVVQYVNLPIHEKIYGGSVDGTGALWAGPHDVE